MKTYLSVYLGAAVLAIITTPIVIYVARRLNIVDAPDVRKVHSKPIPRVGGVAIFVSMMALTLPVLFLRNPIGDSFRVVQPKIVALLVAAGFVFIVGLVDDVRGLRVRVKFLGQLIAALIVCSAGIRIPGVVLTDSLFISFGWLSWPLTAWTVLPPVFAQPRAASF
jgi:UDP-GlcNAc:undecaprenyl-phosphate GlcNAc-1-phosphate transferase